MQKKKKRFKTPCTRSEKQDFDIDDFEILSLNLEKYCKIDFV